MLTRMMTRNVLIYLAMTAAAVLLSSCTKEDKELTIADQEAAIETYISQNFQDYKTVHRNGTNRIIIDSTVLALPDSLEYGDSLHFYYAGYIFTSSPSSLFSTNNETVAEENGYSVTDPDFSIRKILFSEDCMISGLVNGLYGVREGEHCILLFSAKYGFYDDYVYNIPKLSALAYEIWVDKVIKNR